MRLSMCIPTYNRADKLSRLLDSIAAQRDHGLSLEVAISDNGSTDDTAGLVARYQQAGLPIVYDRVAENRGFDRNMLNAVAIASGEYCWIFGSDDVMLPGALKTVEQCLRRNDRPAGIMVGLQSYNADLSLKLPDNNQVMNLFAAETTLVGREAIIAALSTCFGFISTTIVRRELWAKAVTAGPIERLLNGYVHFHAVAMMLDDQSRWICLPERLVVYRTGNDSFSAASAFARTRLDIVGYDLAVGDTLGRDHPIYHSTMSRVAVVCIAQHFRTAKFNGAGLAYWREAVPASVAQYWRYPAFWLSVFPIALVPGGMLRAARSLYRRTLKPADRRPVAAGLNGGAEPYRR